MATIKNLSDFDFGCTQVDLIRTGTGAETAWGISNAEKLTDKAFKITPANDHPSAAYELSLYVTNEEVTGEGSLPPTSAALANAFAHATGRRLRELPMTPERVKASLS